MEVFKISSLAAEIFFLHIYFKGLNHVGLLVADADLSKAFYIDTFGFIDDTHLRPNLPYPGAFLRFGPDQIHLMQVL